MLDLPLETRRTRLRPVTHDDLEAVHAILGDPDTTAGVSWGQPNEESTARWIRRRSQQQLEHGFSMWAVELVELGEIVGLCGLFPHDGAEVELGYVTRADSWRQGLATEAAAAVLAAAEARGLEVFATIRTTNEPSLRVARRIGLVEVDHVDDERGRLLVFRRSPAPVQ